MADKVLYQDGDDITELNESLLLALDNQTNYVERGLGLNPDFGNNTLDVGTTSTWGNFAIVEDGVEAYALFPDQRTGLSLPETNGVNYVYISHDPDTDDDITFHIDSDQTPPSTPSLLIGTVDTSSNSSTEKNRDPSLSAASVATKTIGGGAYHYVSDYNSLSDAISAAASGDRIYLSNATYSVPNTSKDIELVGAGGLMAIGSEIVGTPTFSGRVVIRNCTIDTDITLDDISMIRDCWLITGNTATLNADFIQVIGNTGRGTFEFASGTSGGIADANNRVTVTDNGANSIGDLG